MGWECGLVERGPGRSKMELSGVGRVLNSCRVSLVGLGGSWQVIEWVGWSGKGPGRSQGWGVVGWGGWGGSWKVKKWVEWGWKGRTVSLVGLGGVGKVLEGYRMGWIEWEGSWKVVEA